MVNAKQIIQTEVVAMTQQETKNLDALINRVSFELINEIINITFKESFVFIDTDCSL